MKKKTIGILSDSVLSGNTTGVGNYAASLIQTLTASKKKHTSLALIDYENRNLGLLPVHLIRNPFPFLKTYLWHNYIPTKIAEDVFDYILNFTGVPHLIPYKSQEIFFVYDISWYLFPYLHPVSRVLFYRMLFSQTLRHSRRIVVDSMHAKAELIKYFHVTDQKITVIYPQIHQNNYPYSNSKTTVNGPYILFVGTLEPRKNIVSLIHAFYALKNKYAIPHKLIIAGKKGWKYEPIFRTVNTLHLKEDVVFTGYITNVAKQELFTHADFFVYPSVYEGFGIPVLEAMYAGCPVITTNSSSLPEAAGNAAILVPPGNTEMLEGAMIRLIRSPSLRKTLRTEGKIQAGKFQSDNPKNAFNTFISSILEESL